MRRSAVAVLIAMISLASPLTTSPRATADSGQKRLTAAGPAPPVFVGVVALPLVHRASGPASGIGAGASGAVGDVPTVASVVEAAQPSAPFPGGLLIADRGKGRLIVVNDAGRIVWRFPVKGSLPKGQSFSADDAFLSPDGRTITANEEDRQVIVRIDIATRRVIWEYGHYGVAGARPGYLHNPDDAYPLSNGDIVVADIVNCRILEISPGKRIVRQWGQTGVCAHHPGLDYNLPNGDTPLADGGLLTEIRGSRVIRLGPTGRVIFDVHVPAVYPSDAQLDANGNVVVSDYATVGAVLAVSPHGKLLWRYGPRTGPRRLDHPSLAVPRPDGTVVLNDDFGERVLLIDPHRRAIVWHYGTAGDPGNEAGDLHLPDGIDQIPLGIFPGA